MNLLDEQAWQREFDHLEEKQKQCKEAVTFSGGKTYELPIKDESNEK